MESPFIDPRDCNGAQLAFLTVTYGYVLFAASNLISDGSELLLLVPAMAGLVGSVVLPVLGAVPDGMMVLFSGLGPDAQEQVSVGVGALAGSTIMLLTLPWFLAILGGRVNLENGQPTYRPPPCAGSEWKKLQPETNTSLTGTGVGVGPLIQQNAKIMIATACLYLIIQVPAVVYRGHQTRAHEHACAAFGTVACTAAFFYYMYLQYLDSQQGSDMDVVTDRRVEAIRTGEMNLQGAMSELLFSTDDRSLSSALLETTEKARSQMTALLKPFFGYYDNNGDGKIDKEELRMVLRDLHEFADNETLDADFRKADVDSSGYIDLKEFVEMMIEYVKKGQVESGTSMRRSTLVASALSADMPEDEEDDDEDGEEDMPEDLEGMSPEEQQKRIKMRACWQMGLGTFLVLIFSDPAVDVLSEIGRKLDVSAFYVSFVLAPMASNASELVAAYSYAKKKTRKSMTISLATLEGAACMNNTFCFGIFLALVYAKGLLWTFSAETYAIMLVQFIIGAMSLSKKVHRLADGAAVLFLYPLSLIFVYTLEAMGFD